ncbi:DMT family transporter [Xanthobacter sp. KR7-65]|uniref:DMT family transporter n=1 Tax=Xanthobacter sp. KR7-65 TaxID=3156612 RepID=UPI0032B62752
MLWAVFTIIAAAAQTARNAMQRELTTKLGTAGATHVRFLFGFPFAVLFLIGTMVVTKLPPPSLTTPGFWPWIVLGALSQIIATALMLSVMNRRSFVAATAYIKTEPVQVAVFGLVFLHDQISAGAAVAIIVATAGVLTMSIKPAAADAVRLGSTLLGLGAGAMFALSAIGYRGAILALAYPNFVVAATFALVVSLAMQAGTLTLFLALRDPLVLRRILRLWRPSMFAGLMGALGSAFWFLAFAITAASNVRTLATIEILFAQVVSTFIFKQNVSFREMCGIVLIIVGVSMLICATA